MLQHLTQRLIRFFRERFGPGTDPAPGVQAYRDGDYDTALRLLQPLAARGNAEAKLYLSWMYQRGQRVAADADRAAQLLRESADAGFSWAQFQLARHYRWGDAGFPQSPEKAVALLQQAEAQGLGVAMFELLDHYEQAQAHDLALELLQKWANLPPDKNKTVAAAMRTLGHRYSQGRPGLPPDDDIAFSWYQKAAAAGDESARIVVEALGGDARNRPSYAGIRRYLRDFVASLTDPLPLSSCNGIVQSVRERSLELEGDNLILRYVSETSRAGASPERRHIELLLPLQFPEKATDETRLYWFEQTGDDGTPLPRTAVVYLEPWSDDEKQEPPLNSRPWDELAFPLWPAGKQPDLSHYENHEFLQALRHLRRLLGISPPEPVHDD